jgi:predicted DNA-binding ribbon-helix-helix protein
MSTRESAGTSASAKQPADMGSTLVNRNVTVSGHRTSVRLEPAMWHALKEVCVREHVTLHDAVSAIAEEHAASSLTSSIRAYLLRYFQSAATEDGHRRAGHGDALNRYRGLGYGRSPV